MKPKIWKEWKENDGYINLNLGLELNNLQPIRIFEANDGTFWFRTPTACFKTKEQAMLKAQSLIFDELIKILKKILPLLSSEQIKKIQQVTGEIMSDFEEHKCSELGCGLIADLE